MHKNIFTADKVVYKRIVPKRLQIWETWPSSDESSNNEASFAATCAMVMTATGDVSKDTSNMIQSTEIFDLLDCVNKRNNSHIYTKSAYFIHAFPVSSDASERSSSTAVRVILKYHLSQTYHSWGCHNQAADKYIILLLMQLSRLLTDHGYNHLSFAVPGLVLSFINYNW